MTVTDRGTVQAAPGTPDVKVVVVLRDGDDALASLQALEEGTPAARYSAALVADGGDAGVRQLLRLVEGDAEIAVHDEPVGTVAAWHAAAEAAGRHGFVALLEDSIVVRPGWLDGLLERLDVDPRLALVQPKVVAGRVVAEAGVTVLAAGEPVAYGAGFRPDAPPAACDRATDGVVHGCLVVRADALAAVGGLDRSFTSVAAAGTDLVLRLQAAGWKTVYVAGATVETRRAPVAAPRDDLDLLRRRHEARLATHPVSEDAAGERWPHRPRGGLGPGEGHNALPADEARRILVVDPWSPTFDRDTGHLRLTQMITCLREAGHHVTYLARQCFDRDRYAAALAPLGVPLYGPDPSQVAPEMLDRSIRSVFDPPFDWLLTRHRFDTVVFSYFQTAEDLLPIVRRRLPEANVIVDSVDVHYVREARMAEAAAVETEARELRSQALATRRRELTVYSAADRVLCVTDDDAAVVRPAIGGVEVAVVPCVYEDVPTGPAWDERRTVLFVGSALHTANPDAVEWWVDEVGPRLAELLPGVPLTVVGYDPHGVFESLAGPHVRVVGQVPSVLPYLHEARVSVAPLRYGAGMKGKVIEAMMAGAPVVGTTIAAEGIGIDDGLHALVADDPAAFAEAVASLYADPARWASVRAAGRRLAEERFGMARMRSSLGTALAPVARRQPRR